MTDLILSGHSVGGRHVLVDVAIEVDVQGSPKWVLSAEQALAVAFAWRSAPGYADADRAFTYAVDNSILFSEVLDGSILESCWRSRSVRGAVQFAPTEMPLDVELHSALDWLTPQCLVCRQGGHVAVTRAEAALLHDGRPVREVLPDVPGEMRDQMLSGTHPKCWVQILNEV